MKVFEIVALNKEGDTLGPLTVSAESKEAAIAKFAADCHTEEILKDASLQVLVRSFCS